PSVIVRLKDDYDGAEPAPNSVAALNLVRFEWMLGLVGAKEKALQAIDQARPQWSLVPHALPQMLCAFELLLTEPRTVVLAGDPQSADLAALAAVVHESLGLRRVILAADGGAGQAWLATQRAYVAEMHPVEGRATAYVCE